MILKSCTNFCMLLHVLIAELPLVLHSYKSIILLSLRKKLAECTVLYNTSVISLIQRENHGGNTGVKCLQELSW